VAQVFDLVTELAMLDRPLDLQLHLFDFERLLHVVERADLHRLDGGVDGSERGHQDHGGAGLQLLRRAEHVHAVAAAHLQVAEHDVVLPFVELLDGHVSVGCLVDLMMRIRQRADDPAPQ
jgi:hypothetical protein